MTEKLPLDVVQLIMQHGSVFDIEEWRRTSKGICARLESPAFWMQVFAGRTLLPPRVGLCGKSYSAWPEQGPLRELPDYKWRVVAMDVYGYLRQALLDSAKPMSRDYARSSAIFIRPADGARLQVVATEENWAINIAAERWSTFAVDPVVAYAALQLRAQRDEGIHILVDIYRLFVYLVTDAAAIEPGRERQMFFDAFLDDQDQERVMVDYRRQMQYGIKLMAIGSATPAELAVDRIFFMLFVYLLLMRGFEWVEPEEWETRRRSPFNQHPKNARSVRGAMAVGAGQDSVRPEVHIATWNIRNLGTRADETRRFDLIAKYISQLDVVAVQELMNLPVLDKILGLLPQRYRYVHTQHKASREYYAYFYDSESVTLINSGQFDDSARDVFIREPFVATFKSRHGFDFTLLTVHIYYGSGKNDRRPEVAELANAAAEALRRNGQEENLIMLGDFNLPPTDKAWKAVKQMGFVPLLEPPSKTTVGGVSLLDNIWMREQDVRNYVVRYGFVPFDRSMGRERAKQEISDHRPVWVTLRADVDRDFDEYGDLADLKL